MNGNLIRDRRYLVALVTWFFILFLGLACSLNKKKKEEIPATKPNLNKMIVLYETTASYDTLNIEVNQKINLFIDKFIDTRTGEIVKNNKINRTKIKWKSSDLSILNCKKIDGYANIITGMGKGTAKITITADLRSLDYPYNIVTEINFKVFNPTINKISVTPGEITIRDSTQVLFSAKAEDSKGIEVKNEKFMWYSSDESIASVDSTGMVTGHLPGIDKQSCFIFASIENKNGIVYSDSSLLNVVRQEIYTEEIVIEPEQALILLGSDVNYKASAYMADSKKIENAYFEWKSASLEIAVVEPMKDMREAVATGVGVGDTIISASIYRTNFLTNVSGNSKLRIVDSTSIDKVKISPDTDIARVIGETQEFSASAYDSTDTFINGVSFTWFSSDETIATITPVIGTKGVRAILQAIKNGKVEIRARACGGKISNPTSVAVVIVFLESFNYDVNLLTGQPRTPGLDTGYKSNAKFNYPFAIATASNNEMYVADTYSNQIKKVDLYGFSEYIAGSPVGKAGYKEGHASEALFNRPGGIAVDNRGNIYIADTGNFRIRKISIDMSVYLIAGNGDNNFNVPLVGYGIPGSQASFGEIYGLAVNNNTNTLYAADATNHCIYKIDLNNVYFDNSYYIDFYAGIINDAQTGVYDKNWVGHRTIEAAFGEPKGLTIDASGNIYVSDSKYNCIKKIGTDNYVTFIAGNRDSTIISGFKDGNQGELNSPRGIVYYNDILYIADTRNNAIRKLINLSSEGKEELRTIAGQGPYASGYVDDTSGDKAEFYFPAGIAILGNKTIVADTNNHVLRSITAK